MILHDSIDSNNFELRRFSIASNTIAFVSAADLSFKTQLNTTISTGSTIAMITTTLKWNYNVSEVDIQTSNGRNGLGNFVGGHTCTTTDDGAVDGAEEPQITGTKNTTFVAMANTNTWLYSASPTELDLLKTIVWRGLARN
ncbi:MAG: hypothetical protein P8P24_01690 [Planktomarina sp.]|nr:hypothetical protein [Planktomarina sp.]MDG1293983.1 hypothetical protein [Planktomarina sp.]MDT2071094.1 hypothetical protein [Planktomarina sp.]